MALVLKDRVKVTTTTTGTGAFAIGGAQFGFQGFSAFADGDTTFYTVVDHATGAWETGVGTYSLAGPTLARTAVLDSSNAGGLVNFGVGPKDVFVSYPAGKAVSTEGDVTLTGPLSVPAGASGAQVPQAQEVVGVTSSTGSAKMPSGTTAQRDGSPGVGYTRFNSTLGTNETWNGSNWVQEHGGKAGPVTAAGTSTSISGIPSWANHVDVVFKKLSTTGADHVLFRLGSGSIQTTGYESRGALSYGGGGLSLLGSTVGIVYLLASATETRTGTLSLKRETGNTWIATISGGGVDHVATSFGLVTLSGALDLVDVAVAAGTFDLGTITAYWRA